jgi:hypothetical protein
MGFEIRLSLASVGWLALVPTAIALFACEEPTERKAASGITPGFYQTTRPARSSDWADAIRNSADAAFATLDGPTTQSETRVGLQPWPEDLPVKWPILESATVVADTRRSGGERLLLVDVPGAPDQVMDSYQSALRDGGYEVDRPRLRRTRRALHAQSPEHRAVLTFFARKELTRIEILFLTPATG